MKNWKETRNYRRIKDNDGNIVANIITINGEDVEVTEEVFLAYSQSERRERYISEEQEPDRILSLEQLLNDHVPCSAAGIRSVPSAEDMVLALADKEKQAKRIARLRVILADLEEPEKALIQALYFDRIPIREYARRLNVRLNTVQYRRDRLLKKLYEKILL